MTPFWKRKARGLRSRTRTERDDCAARRARFHRIFDLEQLEDRTLLSVSATLTSGLLDVQLAGATDSVTIEPLASGIEVMGTNFNIQTFVGVTALTVQGGIAFVLDAPSQAVDFQGPGTLNLTGQFHGASLTVSDVSTVDFNNVTIAAAGDVTVSASASSVLRTSQGQPPPSAGIALNEATIQGASVHCCDHLRLAQVLVTWHSIAITPGFFTRTRNSSTTSIRNYCLGCLSQRRWS